MTLHTQLWKYACQGTVNSPSVFCTVDAFANLSKISFVLACAGSCAPDGPFIELGSQVASHKLLRVLSML